MGKGKKLKGNEINWNQVFYFTQIALHGSLKEAAAALGVSPPTLSEHLAQLEKDLEVELFHRQHRKLVLTSHGGRLFHHAKQMFETGQRLLDVLSPIPLGCYPISVGMVPIAASWLAYRVIDEFLETADGLSMKVLQTKHEDLEKALLEARFDFGFSDRGSERRDIVPHLIFTSCLRFYVSPEWEGKSLTELCQKLPVLYFSNDSTTRGFVEHLLRDLDITPKDTISSEFPGLLYELCKSGRGIGVFNEASVKQLGDSLKAVPLPRGTLEIQDKLYVLWTKDAENSAAIQQLKKLLSSREEFSANEEFLTGSDRAGRKDS